MPTPQPRAKVKKNQTWNAESVFASPSQFDAEVKNILDALPSIQKYKGHLGDSVDTFLEAMSAMDALEQRSMKVRVYATMSSSVDANDEEGAAMNGKAMSALAQVGAAMSYVEPELLSVGEAKLRQWIQSDARMKVYEHFVNDLFRKQAHVRSAEVEELMGMLRDPFGTVRNTASLLANADFKFKPAKNSKGKKVELTQSAFDAILNTSDRKARQTAWENYNDKYLEAKNTLASNLTASIKANVFNMKARKFNSTLEATLFNGNVPVEMFHNLLNIFKKNLPLWHKYWKIRRKALGVKTLNPYDVWAPLTTKTHKVPFEKAVDWICEGLAPMGEEYVRVMRRGCLHDRWVDWSPNAGKRQGAFSTRVPSDTHPFIMMSYTDDVGSMSTLAHELGHSMHAYYASRAQPMIYYTYPSIISETASNFNQAMTRAHLLKTNQNKYFQTALLEEAMDNFHRYFFIMPTLARFELETHQRVEQGQPLTADAMIELMADLFSEGFGGEMNLDRQRVGITWGTFTTHLYIDFYSFQYAIGISAANAIAKRILDGVPNAAQDHINFLKAGSSVSPMDVYRIAGIDMTTTQPIEDAFSVLEEYVDRLGVLTSK
ncbi:MAG TPA: oligoendopeptidase F [Anaerolineales bacterium]|nr:oligoendopeptidase F [Anaerolineales bacterium]HNS60466.1 oligoendopeptidase F [Anaerolineales bacterium]